MRDYLVEKPFIKYECYYFDDDEEEAGGHEGTALATKAGTDEEGPVGGSLTAGNGGGNGGRCAAGKGRWYAEFGARNLEIGGPLQVRVRVEGQWLTGHGETEAVRVCGRHWRARWWRTSSRGGRCRCSM